MTRTSETAADGALPLQLARAGLLLVVFVFLPGLANPFVVPKESAVALTAGFALFLLATGPRIAAPPWPRRWAAILVVPLLVATAAALPHGATALASDGPVRWWCYAAFVLGLQLACTSARDAEGLTRWMAVLGGIEGGLVVLQVVAGHLVYDFVAPPSAKWLAFGTMGNPNWVGAFLAATLPLALARVAAPPAPRAPIRASLVAAATVAGLIATLSRGAWIAAVSGLAVMILLAPRTANRRAIAAAAVGFVLGVAAVLTGFGGTGVQAGLTRTASVSGRLRMWEISAAMIAARPVTGWGPGGFAGAYPDFQRAYVRAHGEPITDLTDHPHNDYLYLAAELGVPAAVAFVGMLVFVLRRATAPEWRARTAPLAAALTALSVDALGDIPFRLPATAALFCVLVVAVLAPAGVRPAGTASWRPVLLARVALACLAALAVVQATRLLLVDRWVAGACRAGTAGDAARAEWSAGQALRLEPGHGDAWTALAQARAAAGDDAGARVAATHARARRPTAAVWYLIADLETRMGHPDRALAALAELRDTMPGLLRPRVLLAEAYADRGDVAAAQAEFARVLAMRSKVPTADERALHTRAARGLRALGADD